MLNVKTVPISSNSELFALKSVLLINIFQILEALLYPNKSGVTLKSFRILIIFCLEFLAIFL